MKVLISKNYKAVRFGIYVTANQESGEFVLDTEDTTNSPANATLHEIAKANKIEVAKNAKKEDLLTALEEGITELDLPEMNEKPDTMIVEEIVEAGVKKGLEDEDMVIQIIEAGVKFKFAAKMFQQAKERLGFTVSNKDRKESAYAILKAAKFAPEEYSEVAAMAETIADKVADTEINQAMSLIKKYAKEMEIDLPKPEKGKSGVVGGFRGKVQAFMLKNPLADIKAFTAFVKGEGKDQKVADRMWKSVDFAQKLAKAMVKAEAK